MTMATPTIVPANPFLLVYLRWLAGTGWLLQLANTGRFGIDGVSAS